MCPTVATCSAGAPFASLTWNWTSFDRRAGRLRRLPMGCRLVVDATLPLLRVSTGVKAGNDGDGVLANDKEQRVGKAMNQGATHVTKHEGIVQCVVGKALYDVRKLGTEPAAKADTPRFVPVLRGDDVRSRRRREDDREPYGQRRASSALSLSQGKACERSSSSVARRRSSSACWAGGSATSASDRLSHNRSMRRRRSRGESRAMSSEVSCIHSL
jgi:hypothetical protein